MSASNADMMRPSVQLPSVSGVDSKLGLTMVRPIAAGASSAARKKTCMPDMRQFLVVFDLR